MAAVPHRPLISVVVPVFNKVEYVAACLESIRTQTYGHIEVLCVDDGSDDGSSDILVDFARRDRRFRVIQTSGRTGEGAARNRGIEAAVGQAVFFVDADDWLERTALASLLELRNATDAPLVRGSVVIHRPTLDESPEGWASVRDYVGPPFPADGAMPVPIWGVWTYLYDRAFIDGPGLRFSAHLVGADLLFLARCLVASPAVGVTRAVVYHYRQDPPSLYARPDQIAHELEVHLAIKDLLFAAGLEHAWTERQCPNTMPYLLRMFGRGVSFRTRLRIAHVLQELLVKRPLRASRPGVVRLHLVAGVIGGAGHSALMDMGAMIRLFARRGRWSARRSLRIARRIPFRVYAAMPGPVRDVTRWIRRGLVSLVWFACYVGRV